MKFPWDKKYLTISFHVIFTLAAVYACKLAFDALAFFLSNIDVAAKAAFVFLGKLFSAFKAVISAFIVAYLFDPAVDFLQGVSEKAAGKAGFTAKTGGAPEKRGKKARRFSIKREKPVRKHKRRTSGTVLLYLIFSAVLAAPVIFIIKKMNGTDPKALFGDIGNAVTRISGDLSDLMISISISLAERGAMAFFLGFIGEFTEKLSVYIKNAGGAIAESIPALGGFILNFFLGLIIAFYFLRDKEAVKHGVSALMDAVLPGKANARLKNAARDIHEIFSGYIRGQFADAMIVALMLWVYLSIIGVDFALIIAVISGVSNLIPYLGAIVCYALAVSVAFISGTPLTALYATLGIFAIQQIDGIFIVPRVVGKRVRLSPVTVIISLAVAGEMFGIYGMIFAVPACAAAKLFLTRKLSRMRDSE